MTTSYPFLSVTIRYYQLLSVTISCYQLNTDQPALRVDVHDGTAVDHAAHRVCFRFLCLSFVSFRLVFED